ncbi:MAG: hypothetical protein KBT00_06765 [Bacteroidales bacterium]|nr:hypothetical protein [Candidatus Cacconaster merdequi]
MACTSAIFTGKSTPDGRPLLWKHRDTGELNNRVEFFPVSKERKYSFIGLVNSPSEGGEVWTGTNSEGFSIMNTASYNLQEKNADMEDQEGVIMYKALSCCRNLKDFEKLLDRLPKPLGVEANFGVIDVEGGAAYYEVNNYEWRKVDANDPKVAPEGFLIYTNHSYTGRINEGSGYIRYATAKSLIYSNWIKGGDFSPQWIFDNLSRSFYNSILGYDLKDNPSAVMGGWFVDQDFIPRRSTSASIVVKGVNKGEDPLLTVMWTVLGYPPCGIAVPMFVAAGDNQPAPMVKGSEGNNCRMCDETLQRRASVFSNQRSNAKNYFHFSLLFNSDGNGYIQRLKPLEKSNFSVTEEFMSKQYENGKMDAASLVELYKKISFGDLIK